MRLALALKLNRLGRVGSYLACVVMYGPRRGHCQFVRAVAGSATPTEEQTVVRWAREHYDAAREAVAGSVTPTGDDDE